MAADKGFAQITKTFAQNLKKFRLKAELTQEDMIQGGFNYRHYQRLESGSASPSLYTLYRLAKHFKVKVADFFD